MKLKTLILAACFAIMAVVTMTPTTAEAAVCPKGQYSATGQSPCQSCPKGTYAMNWDQRVAPSALRVLMKGALAITPANLPAGEYSVSMTASNALRVQYSAAASRVLYILLLRASTLRRALVPAYPALQAGTLRRACLHPAQASCRGRGPALCLQAYSRGQLAIRLQDSAAGASSSNTCPAAATLRRGDPADPALQAPTLRREPPPAPPAQAAREAFPAAAPA